MEWRVLVSLSSRTYTYVTGYEISNIIIYERIVCNTLSNNMYLQYMHLYYLVVGTINSDCIPHSNTGQVHT